MTNTPGTLHHATADLTCGLIITLARNIIPGHRYATGPDFTRFEIHRFWGMELHGATLGIIGMGQVGTEVARRMRHGFGMNIVYHNRERVDLKIALELSAMYCDKRELLRSSDIVVLLPVLNDETKNMIGVQELDLMKPSAYLINTSRGGVLDHDALVGALHKERLAGVALDVTEPEPLPRSHPLLSMSNVIITPHIGSATEQTRVAMGRLTVTNIMIALEGKVPPNVL